MKKDFDLYLLTLKKRRDEDKYGYTNKDLNENIKYIKECYNNNLSVYKCLEFMSFNKVIV